MRHPWKLPLVVVCLLALAFLPLFPAPRGAAQSVTYTATDTSTPGGAQTIGMGIDGCGKIVGEFVPGLNSHNPFLWNKGTFTDLGTFGGPSGTASAVNNSGTVAGSAQNGSSETRPFIWTLAGGKTDIGGAGAAAAYDINESNQIVGQWEVSPLQDRAFVWTQANGRQIITAPWGTPIAAYGNNNAGDIVGTAETPAGAAHAFFRTGISIIEIGTLGGTNSFAYEVNETAVVVGYAETPSTGANRPFHAFRWTPLLPGGIPQDLGAFPGGTRSIAYGVNASGQIVGYSEVAGGAHHAFLWSDDNSNGAPDAGEMKDLNTLAPVAGWTLEEARGINDLGQIVATGVDGNGLRHAFLLTPDNAGPSPCDVPGSFQFSSAAYMVGEGVPTAIITVTRTGGSDGAVSVGYATSPVTAAEGAGGDYMAASGTLNFANGETSKTFNVTINDDALDETDETLNLTLSSPVGASLGSPSTATLIITDNDAAPTLSVNDVTVSPEGDAGTVNATFAVTLSNASGQTVTVNYATADNSAVAPGDYTAVASTQLTFNAGETSKNVTVVVKGDTLDEVNERFFVNLSDATNATISDAQGVGTINDDDGAPSLSIGDVTVTEGHAGTTAATFTVTLLPASGQAVSVNYATADGTAAQPADYAAASGTLNFGIGETSQTITVNVNGDTTPEAHENFFVNLTSPSAATISDNQAQGTVNNDDTALTINDLTIAEGNSGPTAFNFTVGLSHVSVVTTSVNYATSDGTAAQPGDYTAVTSGTLNIPAGSTSGTVSVQVNGDTTLENNETFNVTLSGASSGASISDNTGVGTITNDDTAPAFSVGDVTVTEGNSGTVNATFAVTLSAPSGLASSVNYTTANGSAIAALGDYTATIGTVSFAAGETTKNVTVVVNGDTTFEPDENFFLNLFSPTDATINDDTGVGTITNDDAAPTISVNDASATEHPFNNVQATFTVTLSNASSQSVTVNFATADVTAVSPPSGSDYFSVSGTLTFSPGQTSKLVAVNILNDSQDEADETFNFNLSGATNATISDGTGVGTIVDDDPPPALSISDTTVSENGTATFNITLSQLSGQTVTVNYTTSNGTAIAPDDYTAVTNGTVTFNPAETTKTATVNLVKDTLDEADETFNVTLSNAVNATIDDGTAVGTIADDDTAMLSLGEATVLEGNSGTTNATFAVTLSNASVQTITVNYATSDNTATAGSDYTAASGTLTFNPGETLKNINVAVIGDTGDELNEEFFVTLSGESNATIRDGHGVGTITDDDGTPALSIGDVSVTEGNSGTSTATFTVTLSPASGQPVTVNYSTDNNTATAPTDYAATGGGLTFAPGETSKTIGVIIGGDTTPEANETFFVVLSAAVNADIVDAQAVGTILDDDTPTLRFSQAAYPASESAHFVTVNVTRSGDAAGAVNVDFATSDGTATERKDYTFVAGTLRFASGETSKSFDVLLTDDAFQESDETVNLTLSNPTGGAALGTQATATVVIGTDDNPPPAFNPIDISSDFVRQHYHDFLNREPDASGLAFWTGEIEQCGADAGCREVKRINVSAAFFQAIEFQETGYLVYRTFKVAYGDTTSPGVAGTVPVVRLHEFLPDTRRIGEGVVVGPGDAWKVLLEANKQAYFLEFVLRPRFTAAFPATLTPAQFVDALFSNAGVTPTAAERQAAIDEFGGAATAADPVARARALRRVAEHTALAQAEFRRAFVLMQYFGYLRRNPDEAPERDLNYAGWAFWLGKLNENNGNFVQAEMVKAFLDATEYRNRFGQ
jgi:probable HAF family extracellular repeat protein